MSRKGQHTDQWFPRGESRTDYKWARIKFFIIKSFKKKLKSMLNMMLGRIQIVSIQ